MTTIQRGRNLIAVSCLLLAGGAQTAEQAIRPITDAETLLAIYTEDWRLHSSGPHKLIVVVWDDGRILWSDDLLNGGPPYRGAQIDASRLTVLLGHLDEEGLFDIDDLTHARFGPDSEFTTILLKSSGKQLEMRSWHELVEDGRRGIARKIGVVANERPRFQVLEEEPQDYLFYRFVWAEIRARALALIPTSGDLFEGEVIMKSRNLSWQERQQ